MCVHLICHATTISFLRSFMTWTVPELRQVPGLEPKHGIYHRIHSTGPPLQSRPQRPNPEKLSAAKCAFGEMEKTGLSKRSTLLRQPTVLSNHVVTIGDWTLWLYPTVTLFLISRTGHPLKYSRDESVLQNRLDQRFPFKFRFTLIASRRPIYLHTMWNLSILFFYLCSTK